LPIDHAANVVRELMLGISLEDLLVPMLSVSKPGQARIAPRTHIRPDTIKDITRLEL